MKRVQAIDVLRGMTLAFMILVNLPGSWGSVFPMLAHSAWNGMTPTDFIFPNFVFVMGVSMYFSLRKQDFTLNGKKVTIPSLLIKPGDVIAVKESSRDKTKIKTLAETVESAVKPKWLDVNSENLTAKVVAMPAREDIDFEINEQLIVELYSK